MKVDAEQIGAQLARGLQPLYVVTGDETLLAIEAADAIRQQARLAGYSERECFTVEQGFNWARLLEAGQSLSLFATQRVIELRMPTGKPGVEGGRMMQRYVEQLPPDVLTLITLPRIDRTAQASAWYAALESRAVMVSADPVGVERLGSWLKQRLRRQEQDADTQTLDFLVDRVQGNLLAAHQEVLKLGLLFGPGKLDFAAVSGAVVDVARFDVFELGEALLAADRQRFVRVLDGLRSEGVGLPLVLWALAEEVRALIRVKDAVSRGQSLAQAMRESRVWGARAKLMPNALNRLSLAQLDDGLLKAAAADRALKGLAGADPWDQILGLSLRLMRRAPTRSH